MRLYAPITKIDKEQRMVWGYASTEARDDQNEIVKKEALAAALPEYLKLGNIREMHQLSAVGKTKEATMDDKGLFLGAKIVDPIAWAKVVEQVYNGFSIGGRVTSRDHLDRSIIDGIVLSEISLVDRPANPEALFDVWKSAALNIEGTDNMEGLATIGETPAGEKLAAMAALLEPVQIWACGVAEHQHSGKADAVKCLEAQAAEKAAGASDPAAPVLEAAADPAEAATAQETPAGTEGPPDGEMPAAAAPESAQTALEAAREAIERANATLAEPAAAAEPAAKGGDDPGDGSKPYGDETYADPGYLPDGKKRYPVTKDGKPSEERIRAAWTYINQSKNCGQYKGGDCAKVKAKIVSAWKEHIDKDGPPSADKASCTDLEFSEFLDALIDEDVSLSAIVISLHKAISDPEQLEALVSSVVEKGARHGATDQVHLDNAEYCCSKAMGCKSASKTEKMDIHDAHKAVLDAGAASLNAHPSGPPPRNATQDTEKAVLDEGATHIEAPPSSPPPRNAVQDTGRNAETTPPQDKDGKVPESPMPKASDTELLQDAIDKVGQSIATISKAGGSQSEILEILAAAEAMKKGGEPPHHILMDMAHKSMKAFSSGSTCKADMPDPERHSNEDMIRVHKAHYHIGRVGGGKCDAGGWMQGRPVDSDGDFDGDRAARSAKTTTGDDLAKALVEKTAENALLTKTLAEIVPLMTSMNARIEENAVLTKRIYDTPQAPRAIARMTGTASLTKAADNGSADGGEISAAQVTEALARMSTEDQTLTMIKAAQKKRIVVDSIATAAQQREHFPSR